MYKQIVHQLKSLENPQRSAQMDKYFKNYPGGYGYPDTFLGLSNPQVRQVCRQYKDLPLTQLEHLIVNPYHEVRLCALLIATDQVKVLKRKYDLKHKYPGKYNQSQIHDRRVELCNFYMQNLKYINNWDLVDLSAPWLVGTAISDNIYLDQNVWALIESENVFARRTCILASWAYIRKDQFQYTFDLCKIMCQDKHPLIEKALGWMLREIGKRNPGRLQMFIEVEAPKLSATTLSYALEKFEPTIRQTIKLKNRSQ